MGNWFATFMPAATTVSHPERLRGACGAFVGLLLTGLVSTWAVGASLALPLLIAPMGASAVLLFAVPASPLAQPWSIVGGNLVASLCGVTALLLFPQPLVAGPLAVAAAIASMFALRCVHPPSGAVALTAVVGGPAIAAMGYRFVLWPVLLNSVLLALSAIAFNNAVGRRYPHRQVAAPTAPAQTEPLRRLSFAAGDLDAVLKRYDQVLAVSRDDMESLFLDAEMAAYRRRFGVIACAEIMSRDVVAVESGTPLQEAWTTMRKNRLRALPVVDPARRVVGMVHDIDFMNDAGLDTYHTLAARFRRLLHPGTRDGSGGRTVGAIMREGVTARETDNIVTLVPLLSGARLRYVPIVDAQGVLAGIVAQSDLIAALYRSHLSETAA